VREVSVTSIYPPDERWEMMFSLEGHPISRAQDIPLTFFGVTDVPYLKTVGIPIMKGRDFLQTDRENTPVVAVINQTFVNRFFRGEDPLGKRILVGAQPGAGVDAPYMHEQSALVTVVGVMADSKNDGLAEPVAPQIIALFRQMPFVNYGFKDFIVRSDIPPQILEREIEQRFHAMDPRLPLSEMMTITETVEAMTADKRFTGMILAAFAVLGLALAVVGIYGVVSYLVAQRNQELGIRLALGANRTNVLWLIVREGMLLGVSGVCIGLAGTAIASRGLNSLLYNISALDVSTLVAASALLLLVALAASAVPARRAMKIDPIQVLRNGRT
jgi:putative ABC transport system permease protein